MVGGAFCEWKYDTLFNSGWTGFIISDWGPITGGGGSWGMQDYTNAEPAMITIKLGMTQMGGFSDLDTMVEAWELLVDGLGEEDTLAMMRDRAYENILVSMRLEQFENPYCSIEHVRETCGTEAAYAYGLETEANSIVMLKNSGGVISAAGEKKTVYIPYTYTPAYSAQVGPALQEYPATCEPCLDTEIAARYFNVVTDTLGAPSGADGGYQESDIIRASAADIASCDMILLYMIAPQVDSVAVYEDEEQSVLSHDTAPSIQYEPYVATTARETSISGDKIIMVASGQVEPNGLLPLQQPTSMEAVEAQKGEDLPRDLACYVDANGNAYDFTFGLNWSGKIDDQSVKTYSAEPLTRCSSFEFKYANE